VLLSGEKTKLTQSLSSTHLAGESIPAFQPGFLPAFNNPSPFMLYGLRIGLFFLANTHSDAGSVENPVDFQHGEMDEWNAKTSTETKTF